MTEQTLAIAIGGLLVVVFGGFASYMADRQRRRTATESKAKRGKKSALKVHAS